MRSTIDFALNGERVALPGRHARQTVLAWLREVRRLVGTKEGCAEGDCGACTAVLDGLPVNTCLLFVGALDGKALTTVEGLKGEHPAQRAMVECHGSQCGFCTPGFVMAMVAFYEKNPSFQKDPFCDALAGNLCRCTGYAPNVAAGQKMFEYPAAVKPAPLPSPREGMRSDPAGLVCPIGLVKAGKHPAAVAVSAVAQLLALQALSESTVQAHSASRAARRPSKTL